MKKYMDIERYGKKDTIIFTVGDPIMIQEKLDGSNASIKRDGNRLLAYSRNQELSEDNTLRGFYEWVQTLTVEDFQEGFLYFGEWLVRHKLHYGEEAMDQFYLFDVYDLNKETYLHPTDYRSLIPSYIKKVPVLYDGPYQSDEHLQSFVGKTMFSIQAGEGIVIKNTAYRNRYGNQKFVKWVTDSFAEKAKVKKQQAPKKCKEQEIAQLYITPARVEKMLYKLIDEGIMPDNYGRQEMGIIMKHLVPRLYEDVLKEESDEMPKGFDSKLLQKEIGKIAVIMIKKQFQKVKSP
ncbi:RNA ligase family protein [Risungbinella massiliensis]|uniref:RNA ligase family protein n=1 Tax=Risungbinella massiliensis TaxID=1329796 RepID=UPI0005CC845C|nr:RNA ligase family protein [Risungbinella massiliensis]